MTARVSVRRIAIWGTVLSLALILLMGWSGAAASGSSAHSQSATGSGAVNAHGFDDVIVCHTSGDLTVPISCCGQASCPRA